MIWPTNSKRDSVAADATEFCFFIYIDDFQNLIELADIDLYLKRHDGIPFSDFHKNVDFSVLFDFGDNDFSVSIDAAAEIYCDELIYSLEK